MKGAAQTRGLLITLERLVARGGRRGMERAAKRGKGNQGQAVHKKQSGAGASKMGSLQRLREAADSMGWSVEENLTRTGGARVRVRARALSAAS